MVSYSHFQRLCKQWRLTDPGLGSDLEGVVLGISQRRVPHQTRRIQASSNWSFAFTGQLVKTPTDGKSMTGGSSRPKGRCSGGVSASRSPCCSQLRWISEAHRANRKRESLRCYAGQESLLRVRDHLLED